MKIRNSKFIIINIAGMIFVNHMIDGEVVDTMKVYGLNSKPYCKRLG